MRKRRIAMAISVCWLMSGADFAKEEAKPTWYNTQPIDVSLVEQKKTMSVDAKQALKIFDTSENRIADDWEKHLPKKVESADRVSRLPEADGITNHVKQRKPLEVHILGFDKDRVRAALARHVGNHLWHWYHDVAADLLVERSDKVDELLNLDAFAAPFTRTFREIGHGDSPKQVRDALGPPDAYRLTQAVGLSWDYYFDEGITIEYKHHVFKIIDEVPKAIRDRITGNPQVKYREP